MEIKQKKKTVEKINAVMDFGKGMGPKECAARIYRLCESGLGKAD